MHSAVRLSSDRESLLTAAKAGDELAFAQLIDPYRGELHVHCYRMLGSLHDADDALQEALLRAWRALPRFGGPRLLRPWLYRIATNVCINMCARPPQQLALEAAPHTPRRALGPESRVPDPYPEPLLTLQDRLATPEARYEQREAVELAFVAALQHLTVRQRAVLLLREVLGFSAAEVAALLPTTVASVNSALQRARRTLDERRPDRSQQATLRALGGTRVRELAQGFADAWDRGDVEAMLAALSEDIIFTMPPAPPREGADAAAAFLPLPGPGRWRLMPTAANAQLAFGAYRWDQASASYRAAVLDVVDLRDAKVACVVAFARPELFVRFGLPPAITGARTDSGRAGGGRSSRAA